MTINLKDLLGWGCVAALIIILMLFPVWHDFVMQVRANTAMLRDLQSKQRPLVINHFARASYPQQVVTAAAVQWVEDGE